MYMSAHACVYVCECVRCVHVYIYMCVYVCGICECVYECQHMYICEVKTGVKGHGGILVQLS